MALNELKYKNLHHGNQKKVKNVSCKQRETIKEMVSNWFCFGFCRTHARPKLQSHDALFPRGIRAWNLTSLSRDSGCEAHEHTQMELGPDCW